VRSLHARSTACIACLLSAAATATASDDSLPVLRAHSRSVDVNDGGRLYRGGWSISPEVPVDVYYARRAPGDRTVTFRSDVDSIRFDVSNGHDYDFVVQLDGKICCHTRISTLRRMPHLDAVGNTDTPVSIPFTLGKDGKIHIAGRINDSAALDLLVDLGADSVVLFPTGETRQARLNLDGEVENAGSGGTVTRRISNDNRIAVGALRCDHEAVLFVEKQSDRADGILGYNVFDNGVLSIDYDTMQLRIGGEPPTGAATTLPVTFIGTLPAVTVQLATKSGQFDVPLVLDTGSNATIFLDGATADRYGLPGSLMPLGSSRMSGTGAAIIENDVVQLPALRLGALELRKLPLYVEARGSPAASRGGHLGMETLRRFNSVLDLRSDVATFTTSHFRDEPYRVGYRSRAWWVLPLLGGAALVLRLLVVLRRPRRS